HRRYVDAGARSRLRSLHEAVKPQAERYIRMYIALLLDTVATAGTEHDAIVEAIRVGNSGAAQRAGISNSNSLDYGVVLCPGCCHCVEQKRDVHPDVALRLGFDGFVQGPKSRAGAGIDVTAV